MFRLPFHVLCCLILASAAASSQGGVTGALTRAKLHPPSERPNILFIVADDIGVENVGAYGENPDAAHTPVIDQLASEGVLFRNAWSNPRCSPSRSTLLTGQYGFRTGIGRTVGWATDLFELSPDGATLPRVLGLLGYGTAAVGKWHLAAEQLSGYAHPQMLGFDHHRGAIDNLPSFNGQAYFDYEKSVDGVVQQSTTYATTDAVNDTLALVEQLGEPWFVYLAFNAPHGPYHKPPDALHTYDLAGLSVQQNIPLHMKAMTEAMDTEIGRLLAELPPAELARTVVVIVGDNGTDGIASVPPWEPSHAKGTVFEGGVNVPLIVWGDGVGVGESAALVNLVDLYGTALQLAGIHGPTSPDAVSVLPYLIDPAAPSLRSFVYTERFAPNGFDLGFGPLLSWYRAVRNERYKLRDAFNTFTGEDFQELYDLEADPFETTDLLLGALTPEEAAALAELQAALGSVSE